MNSSEILALFGLVNGDLYATLNYPSGELWAPNQRVDVRPPVGLPEDSSSICIVPIDSGAGYYTNFPVDKVENDNNGHVVLTGKKGIATFDVVTKPVS